MTLDQLLNEENLFLIARILTHYFLQQKMSEKKIYIKK